MCAKRGSDVTMCAKRGSDVTMCAKHLKLCDCLARGVHDDVLVLHHTLLKQVHHLETQPHVAARIKQIH